MKRQTPAPKRRKATAPDAGGFSQPSSQMLVARRIDVLKDDHGAGTFLRMEIDDSTVYIVPIGPRLVSVLIEALERSQRFVPSPSSEQQ